MTQHFTLYFLTRSVCRYKTKTLLLIVKDHIEGNLKRVLGWAILKTGQLNYSFHVIRVNHVIYTSVLYENLPTRCLEHPLCRTTVSNETNIHSSTQ